MSWFQTKPSPNKQLSRIGQRVKDITEDTRTINESLISITHTNKIIAKVMEKFENADFSPQKSRIDAIPLDQEYKDELYKVIDNVKERAIAVMKPLTQDAYKIEAGMIAGEIKAKSQLMILETQRKVISSGTMHLNVLKDIEKEGKENREEIVKLKNNMEELNGMVKGALLDYNDTTNNIENLLESKIDNIEVTPEMDEMDSLLRDFDKTFESKKAG